MGTLLLADVVLGARDWTPAAAALAALAAAALAWSYWRGRAKGWVRFGAMGFKAAAVVLLALCLVEPLVTGVRPRPGSNLLLVLADNSRSLQLADPASGRSRGEQLATRLADSAPWLTRLSQDFDVRRYAFDSALRAVPTFESMAFDGQESALSGSVAALAERFRDRPVAGIVVLTDGNATDLAAAVPNWKGLPPIFPVAIGSEEGLVDLSVSRLTANQTNFDAAPVTLIAEIEHQGLSGKQLVVSVHDEAGKELERRKLNASATGEPEVLRFQLRPERPGVSFYSVRASIAGEERTDERPGSSREATLANNRRLVVVDRGGGPYRVLYVAGHPNWEFKFLRRAVAEDDEVNLVGLVRMAKKEPRFAFRSRGERTNSIYRGFDAVQDDTAEQYDEPVLLRLGIDGQEELRAGFPKSAEELFAYHAVILDDIEADFFTQDQLSLLQKFVSQRGAGLLMLGGKGSFGEGKYARTPVGEMLPIYLDRPGPTTPAAGHRLLLTREGWLQPWVRVRSTEQEEQQRLAKLPPLRAVNKVQSIKPGASVLAEVVAEGGERHPGLVVQPFGRGRTAALLVGDLWRWNMHRSDPKEDDLARAWRQTVRWLVAEVPQPVHAETRPAANGDAGLEIVVHVRDKLFEPLDNAAVQVTIRTPDQRELAVTAEPSQTASGQYVAPFVPRMSGAYRAMATATAPDGSEVGRRETGWVAEPETEEFRRLAVNRPLLDQIAQATGGEVLELEGLERFVASLPNRKLPVVENWTYPLWHQWPLFVLAAACLIGEWGLRRWHGLP